MHEKYTFCLWISWQIDAWICMMLIWPHHHKYNHDRTCLHSLSYEIIKLHPSRNMTLMFSFQPYRPIWLAVNMHTASMNLILDITCHFETRFPPTWSAVYRLFLTEEFTTRAKASKCSNDSKPWLPRVMENKTCTKTSSLGCRSDWIGLLSGIE